MFRSAKDMKAPKPEIRIVQTGIGAILKDYTLRVPPHQREYSWTPKEVKKLFEDLTKAISDEPEYFLGTIATIQEATGELKVIDGQQRLATVTILLCEIRNYLRDKDEFVANGISELLEYPNLSQRTTLPKMRLNSNDNDFFCKMVTAKSKADRPQPDLKSHRLISAAFDEAEKQVRNIVSGLNPNDHGDKLIKWIQYIKESAEVILMRMPLGYNAYKTFETLNDRGLGTTQADMVKSYLFEQAETNDRLSEAETSWAKLRGSLDALQQDDKDITVVFIRQALILVHGHLTKDEILDVVQSRAKGAGQAISFCKQLERLAGTYTATFFSEHEKWTDYPDQTKLAIQTLNFFNIQPFRPIMMAVAEKFSAEETVKAYEVLISLGVRIMIASSTSSGSVEDVLNKAAYKIYKGEFSKAKELRASIDSIFPNDQKFKSAFALATVSKAPLARYYLRTLERIVRREPTPWFNINDDKEVINLEHVLPENPDGNWPQFTRQEADSYWRRLGNMALHSKKINSDLRSAPFKEKKPTFDRCPYKLTSQIFDVEDWTPRVIDERQGKMAEFALRAWPG